MKVIPSDRAKSLVKIAAVPAALLVSAGVVWHSSYAAFSAQTDSPNNQWSTGSLALQNDTTGTFAVTGTFMFNTNTVKPGDSGSWCVNVKNAGTLAATSTNPVKFYAPAPANLSSNVLAQALTLTVVESAGAVPGGNTGSCTGYTAGPTVYNGPLSGVPTNYASGAAPAGAGVLGVGSTKGYQLTWSLPASTGNGVAGQTLNGVTFSWGLQVGS